MAKEALKLVIVCDMVQYHTAHIIGKKKGENCSLGFLYCSLKKIHMKNPKMKRL
jgi:hypothetical protein